MPNSVPSGSQHNFTGKLGKKPIQWLQNLEKLCKRIQLAEIKSSGGFHIQHNQECEEGQLGRQGPLVQRDLRRFLLALLLHESRMHGLQVTCRHQ